MAFAISFGELTIDGIADWEEDCPSRVNIETFPRRDGGIDSASSFLAPRRISASGELFADDITALRAALTSLESKLASQGAARLTLMDDGRFITCKKSGFRKRIEARTIPSQRAAFTIEWQADDPFWYSGTDQENVESAVSSSPHAFIITNSGSERTFLLASIKAIGGDKTDVKISNTTTGFYMRYAGTIDEDALCIFDTANRLCTVNGENGLNDFTGSFFLLQPGDNNIVYEGPTSVDVTVTWTERWSTG